MNKVILMGNLTKKPELKECDNGSTMAKFTLAVNFDDKVDFIPIVVFGVKADACGDYLDKGSKVAVVGRIQVRRYENEEDEAISYHTEVLANEIYFINTKPKEEPKQQTKKQTIKNYGKNHQ